MSALKLQPHIAVLTRNHGTRAFREGFKNTCNLPSFLQDAKHAQAQTNLSYQIAFTRELELH